MPKSVPAGITMDDSEFEELLILAVRQLRAELRVALNDGTRENRENRENPRENDSEKEERIILSTEGMEISHHLEPLKKTSSLLAFLFPGAYLKSLPLLERGSLCRVFGSLYCFVPPGMDLQSALDTIFGSPETSRRSYGASGTPEASRIGSDVFVCDLRTWTCQCPVFLHQLYTGVSEGVSDKRNKSQAYCEHLLAALIASND